MPEGANIEIAHHVTEHGQERHKRSRGVEAAVEIFEAVLLAFVAISTAWSGYQSALWDGRSANLYGQSSRIRINATADSTRAGQLQLYDAITLNSWLGAKFAGQESVAREFQKRFRLEFRPAFHAWLATDPFHNPKAPLGPTFMPQYHNAVAERSAVLDAHASEVFEEGARARETGDKYVRTTVLLATVLFLIAVSQRFGIFKVRVGLLCVGVVLLVLALSLVATYPRL
jgi:hypothetical protein